MSEPISPPDSWALFTGLSDTELTAALGDLRLIAIKAYERDGRRVYSAVAVKDAVAGLGWTANMTEDVLYQTVKEVPGRRLISLDSFWDRAAREVRCAAVWIANAENLDWGYAVAVSEGSVREILHGGSRMLSCLRVFDRPAEPDQDPPIAFEPVCTAVWLPHDGRTWGWEASIEPKPLAVRLEDDRGQLVSIDNWDRGDWLGDDEAIAAVWWANDRPWFWNYSSAAGPPRDWVRQMCGYPIDLVPTGPTQFAAIAYQFPKPADPNQANLVLLSGTGVTTFEPDYWQKPSWAMGLLNTGGAATITNALLLTAAEGGWSWWSGNFTTPPGQSVLGLPLAVPPGATNSTWGWGGVSTNFKLSVLVVRVEDGAGRYQREIVQIPMVNAGYPAPDPLPIGWPVYVGVIGPVECVRLTSGKDWVTLAGQVCNGTGRPLTVTGVTARLRARGVITYEATFTDRLTVAQDALGNSVDPPQVGPVVGSDAPLPKFYDGFAVAQGCDGEAVLTVQALVRLAGACDRPGDPCACYGDTRQFRVWYAPVTVMSRLPYDPPALDVTGLEPYRWHWGNGVGSTVLNAHSSPEHRYSYDLGVWDKDGQSLKPGGNPYDNPDYYCWGQVVRAMEDGVIFHVDDGNQDNNGAGGVPGGSTSPPPGTRPGNGGPANVVMVHNAARDLYFQYVHIQQGSAVDAAGTRWVAGMPVRAGDRLGLVGNAGQSSGPHLHVGVGRRDANGFLRSLPMTFEGIKDGDGKTVSGVPVDGEYYSA